MIRRNSCVSRSAQRGFTLVELLVVISIIGTLVALLLPAVQMAREAARRNTCINNQHNITLAVINYTGARKLFPGYRDVIQTNNQTATFGALQPVSWTVAIMPYLERRNEFDQWKQMLGNTGSSGNQSSLPFPFIESLICPSDLTVQQSVSAPISYVVNCGQADLYPLAAITGSPVATATSPVGTATSPLNQPDSSANGIFLSRWDYTWQLQGKLNSLPRNTDDTIRDGKSNTLLLSENLEARNWYDELSWGNPNAADANSLLTPGGTTYSLSNSATNGYMSAPVGGATLSTCSVPSASTPSHLTPEAYAGFVWWPYTIAPSLNAQINGLPQAEVGYATDMFYARPSSNHPGIVVVSYADGRTSTMSETINYSVYCLLMTPDGAKCNPAGMQFITTASGNLPQAYVGTLQGGTYTGGFRNSTISGQDME